MECDICPVLATVLRPATKNREEAHYCDLHARLYLGWGDTFRKIG
jgi:hypothetical protein